MYNEKLDCSYKLVVGAYSVENYTYISYGIAAPKGDYCFKDISRDKDEVENLISLCNELQLSPLHLRDVVDDFLEGK